MLRVLPVVIAVVLAVYCLIDLLQRPPDSVRYLPRWAWGVVVLVVPIVGPVGWLLAGRPPGTPRGAAPNPQRPSRPFAPDDDPEFLAELHRRRQRETDERLRRWEAELAERERELGGDDDNGGPTGNGGTGGGTPPTPPPARP